MRYRITKIIYVVVMSLIILRLGFWQLIQADELSAKADDQRLLTTEIEGSRGTILFSDNSILTSTQPSFLVYIQPQSLKNNKAIPESYLKTYQEKFAEIVAQVFWEEDQKLKLVEPLPSPSPPASPPSAVQVDLNDPKTRELLESQKKETEKKIQDEKDLIKNSILDKLNSNLYWASLGRKVDSVVKKKLEALNLTGLGFENSTARFYPEGSSSAHLLGFVASDAFGGQVGYFGLEGYYNGELRGKKGVRIQEKDAMGLPILIGRFSSKDPKNGQTLTLNTDRVVQHILEEKLQAGREKYGAKGASAIVMDPQTGAIIAMASFPSYDPANVLAYPKENFKNPITADGYEPGSTFKVLIMAAALNEKVVKPDTLCDNCSGPLDIGGFTIRTWNNEYQEKLTMTDTIIHSDNTGMVFTSKKLGFEKLYQYITGFGFGELTNVDLQDEQSPALREKKDWKEIDQATASFGQGISVTALQVVRAVGTIANGGKLMEPHVVQKIEDGQNTFEIKPKIISQPITPETARVVTEIMIQAVDRGEAQFYKRKAGVEKFNIAGKTGTAQIPVAGHYDATKTIASFVGFAPAENPKFVMLVRYDQPTSSIYGADTAAPTFFNIAKDLFVYYGIAPKP